MIFYLQLFLVFLEFVLFKKKEFVMVLIANVNKNWGIGKNGDLLCTFPEDMRRFRALTVGCTLIYGRKTLDSFPDGKPLLGRKNIVITNDLSHISSETEHSVNGYGVVRGLGPVNGSYLMAIKDHSNDGYEKLSNTSLFVTKSIKDAMFLASLIELNSDNIIVCGGESIYRQMVDYCDHAYITMNNCEEEADTFFPNLDEKDNWEKVFETSHRESKSGLSYRLIDYQNNSVKE